MITYPLNRIEYQATDAELFHCTRNSGIYAGDDFVCTVTGADNNVTIGAGIGWIRNSKFSGKVIANKSDVVLDLGLADASFDRWDIVAIQFDKNNNATDFVVKHGTAASTPVRPEIVQTETLYELYLAAFYRKAGATTITASDVFDLRLDPTVCGLMADSVTTIDTTGINAQINALIEGLREEIAGVESSAEIMLKSVYDTDNDGVVDNAAMLGGELPEYYATKTEVETAQTTANNAVKKVGDTMTGAVTFDTTDNTPIVLKMPNAEKTVVPSASQYSIISIRDKNNVAIAKMQYAKRTTGQDDFTIQIENKNGVTSNLQIGVDADGKAFAKVNGSEFGDMDLLWTNASPTSAFAAQTISHDLSGYKQVLIMLQSYADNDGWVTGCALIDVGKTCAMITGLWQQTCGRHATVTTTGITFKVGWQHGGSEDNKKCVPYKIYGIK